MATSEGRRRSLVAVIGRRLLVSLPLVVVISLLSFVLVSLIPGDAARQILGTNATPQAYERLRAQMGLEQALPRQYWNWLGDAVRGDFGVSLFSSEEVTHAIWSRLSVTVSLAIGAIVVSLLVGVSLGVLSSLVPRSVGRSVDAFAMIGFALPGFWVGLMLISVFAVKVGWFPATGYVPISASPTDWLRSIALPVFALSLGSSAVIAKQTREGMLDVLSSEHIRVMWANGIPRRSIVFRHALKGAALPIVTVSGLQMIGLLTGAVLVERVFALPGLGGLAIDSAQRGDLPMVQGLVVWFTILVVLINLLVDLAYSVINPRVHV